MNDQAPSIDTDASPVIGDTYRIERGVARGGFSTIYRASHVEMDRPVALKILKVDEDVDAGVLERFSQEARLTCQINHPNVVTIHEFGQDERGLLYIAMEWLDGDSLNTHLEEHGALSAEEVARFGAEIAAGLQAAHSHDILHRDLKPSNIMLARLPTDERTGKVLDFGIAKALDPPAEDQLRITQEGMFVGTPRYASPEQIQGGELTPRIDIYGTGLLLWESIVGEPAVPSVEFQECCAHHLSEDPWELPAEADCPAPLAEVIERCLEKDPDDRFASCEELSDALWDAHTDIKHGGTVGAPAPTASSWSGRWSRMIFGVLAIVAALALFAYPNILANDDADATGDRPVSVNGAEVETPTGLITQLERRGWTIEGELPDNPNGGTVYRMTVDREGASVTLRALESADGEVGVGIPFPSFRVVVAPDGDEPGPGYYRLSADLFALRHATARNGG